ncbi:MAG: MFS transporter [Saprospiraceae bacterium]|nr:MFS transporter [Saprospiraceae bacterium]
MPFSKNEKIILAILVSINFTHIMDVMIMMPLGDVFMNLFDITPLQFSMLVSSYAVAAFFASLLAVLYLDVFDRRKAMLFIVTGFTVGTYLCATAPSFLFLLIVRFATGLFGGVIGAMVLSVVSDVFKFERRGKALGWLMAGFSAAAALGVPFGLWLAEVFSWRVPFIVIGTFGLILLVIMFFYFPVMRGHLASVDKDRSIKKVFGLIFLDKNQVNALILGFILILGHFLIIPFIAPYMIRNVGFTQAQITYIYLIGGLLTVFSSPLFGIWTDRHGAVKVFAILMVLSFIPVVWITQMGPTPVWLALVATSLFFVLGSGRMIPPQTLITAAASPRSRGSFMSIKSALQQLSVALGSGVSGFVVVFDENEQLANYEWVGYLSIAVCIVALFLAPRIRVAEGN